MEEESYTIYKIYSKDNKYLYIGSTKDIYKRMSKHKQESNNKNSKKYNYKIYKTIRDNGGWSEFLVEKIEDIYCNKKNAYIRETELIKNMNSNLNSINAYASPDDVKEQAKTYRLKNKEKINLYKNTKNNCDCGGSYSTKHKAKHLKTNKHKQHEQQIINNITNN